MGLFLFSETCPPLPLGRTTRVIGPRSATHGHRFSCVDLVDVVPRYPAKVNEIDERAATATVSGLLGRDPATAAGLPTYRRVATSGTCPILSI